MKKVQTLCIIHKHPYILLGMKKRGFGVGNWNGFGGKVHAGETIPDAAHRELFEEAGIEARNMEKAGILNFSFPDGKNLEVHIFRADDFLGEPSESEEMVPKWFHIDEIPFNEMWPDDKHWMPLFLHGKKFNGKFTFDENSNISDFELNTILFENSEEL